MLCYCHFEHLRNHRTSTLLSSGIEKVFVQWLITVMFNISPAVIWPLFLQT
ncbi:hypothetical protein QWZ13_01685 [Reinekea marina]|uniref:hypothetical protein n=1 Tax=Reinekea marina TaxID=1310421 RepID=UPI0025B2C499|nr:hypothetical protein [Reinekea marina]MDN3647616.1 hypothetical protein [Reinekea marina]